MNHTPGATRRQALVSLAGLAGALVAPAVAQQAEDTASALPQRGSVLKLTDVPLLDGSTTFRAGDADGQVLVLYWWASWCPFCALQSPSMNALWLAHKGRGLHMLGLSIDKRADDASAYLRKMGYSFPAGLLTPAVAQVLPKPRGLPVTVLRGRDGRVRVAESGQLFAEDVEQFAHWL